MSTTIIAIIAGAAVVLWLLGRKGPSVQRDVALALESKDVGPLIERIVALRPAAQPNAFNGAIQRVWEAYDRPLALPLIHALVVRHPESRVAQYWLDQVLKVEPELAREGLDGEFVQQHYRPDIAANCGKFG